MIEIVFTNLPVGFHQQGFKNQAVNELKKVIARDTEIDSSKIEVFASAERLERHDVHYWNRHGGIRVIVYTLQVKNDQVKKIIAEAIFSFFVDHDMNEDLDRIIFMEMKRSDVFVVTEGRLSTHWI